MVSFERSVVVVSSYKKELYAILWSSFTLIALIALYSFNKYDPSWFFISSQSQTIHNWCGIVGAQFSALLFFLCGISAYVVVFFGGIFCYWLSVDGMWNAHWERVIAGICISVSLATLCTLHRIDLVVPGLYGGYIGFYVSGLLHGLFDTIGSLLLMYALLHVSLILLLRLSLVKVGQVMIFVSKKIHESRIVYRVSYVVYRVIVLVLFLMYRFIAWLGRLFVASIERVSAEGRQSTSSTDTTSFIFPQMHQPVTSSQEPSFSQEQDQERVTFPDSSAIPEMVEVPEGSVEPSNTSPTFSSLEHENNEMNEAPVAETSTYGLPSRDIFIGITEKKDDEEYKNELEQRARILEEKLERFGVMGQVISIKNGPVVTLFEYQPAIDTKLSKILALEDDLSLALQAHSIRILAPIPGRSVVGFEVSNTDRKDVLFASIVQSKTYDQFTGSLPLILGKNTIGDDMVVDLAKMPHLLIAGSTGSGKSVALNAMLVSLLCKRTPDELKLILIDPKRLEFASYADVAHLLFPIITNPKKSIPILKWVVQQMDKRYEEMAACGARNIFDYNKNAAANGNEHFPFIVVVIDELSDLMLTVGRDVEDLITRITQMARAAGIHMIVATQRPSVDVITGLIKVNFPSRISFRVTSKVDSRTILDCGGADKLLGRGDMLFLDSTASVLRRIHGAYVSDEQIGMVVSHIRSQRSVSYLDIAEENAALTNDMAEDEELFQEVISFIGEVEEVSISLLQRKFRIGYNRSARIIEMLESRGLIMPADGGKTRRVIR